MRINTDICETNSKKTEYYWVIRLQPMVKNLLSMILVVCYMQTVSAQVPISSEANKFRGGDKLCKVVVDYMAPEGRGVDEVWSLGRITKQSEEYLQTIASSRDTVAIFEAGQIHHYLMHGDTLVDKGEQSRRAYCLYSQERPVLRYPFQYGDSISGHYSGNGRNENLKYSRSGWGYTVADGTGVLTDGEDSLQHITRVHLFDDYVEKYYASDTVCIHMQCDRYSWYCAGYRYPVQESFKWSVVEGDNVTPLDSITYMFLPVMQLDLAEDLANDSLLNELAIADALKAAQGSKAGTLSSISAGLSSDGMRLSICYTMSSAGDITFCACDILGNMLGYSHYENKEEGDWQEDLVLSRKPIGNTLMLNVRCGEEVKSIKVYQ